MAHRGLTRRTLTRANAETTTSLRTTGDRVVDMLGALDIITTTIRSAADLPGMNQTMIAGMMAVQVGTQAIDGDQVENGDGSDPMVLRFSTYYHLFICNVNT